MGQLKFGFAPLLWLTVLLAPCAHAAIALPSNLEGRVLELEKTIERDHRLPEYGGGIPNRIIVLPKHPVQEPYFFDGNDSALFTGVYLGSQCLKLSMVQDPIEHAITESRIDSLLSTLENYSHVTQIPGLIARYVYSPSSSIPNPLQDSLGNPWNCDNERVTGVVTDDPAQWVPSITDTRTQYWCGQTSRDQYSGYFFGLQTCQTQLPDGSQKRRAAQLVHSIVPSLIKNKMIIPYGPFERLWGGFTAKALGGNVQRLLLTSEREALRILGIPAGAGDEESFKQSFNDILFELLGTQSWFNQYFEYYSYNLTSLTIFATLESTLPTESEQLVEELWRQHLWERTRRDHNAQITGMHLARFVKDRTANSSAESEAREALWQLSELPRDTVTAVGPSQSMCEEQSDFNDLRSFLEEFVKLAPSSDLADAVREGGKLPSRLCQQVIPFNSRPRTHYYWERSPYILPNTPVSGGVSTVPAPRQSMHEVAAKDGDQYFPAVDTVVAYWLNRRAGVIRGGE